MNYYQRLQNKSGISYIEQVFNLYKFSEDDAYELDVCLPRRISLLSNMTGAFIPLLREDGKFKVLIYTLRVDDDIWVICPKSEDVFFQDLVVGNTTISTDAFMEKRNDNKKLLLVDGKHALKEIKDIFSVDMQGFKLNSIVLEEVNGLSFCLIHCALVTPYGYLVICPQNSSVEQVVARENYYSVDEAMPFMALVSHETNGFANQMLKVTLECPFELNLGYLIDLNHNEFIFHKVVQQAHEGNRDRVIPFCAKKGEELHINKSIKFQESFLGNVKTTFISECSTKIYGSVLVPADYAYPNMVFTSVGGNQIISRRMPYLNWEE